MSALPTPPVSLAARPRGRSSLFVGSTEKAFQVLEAFNGANRRMSLAEIARQADLDRSATQRLVHTLEQLGYLHRLPDSMLYGLSAKVLSLSYNYLRSNELIDKASPYLLDISRTIGETTNLQELDGHEIVFLARFHGKHLVNVDFSVGARVTAVFTASGRAILSRYGEAEQQAVIAASDLKPVTPMTEVDPAKLLEHLRTAREQGYAAVENQSVMGDISVAAPIIDHRGVAVAAINISVPTTRYSLAEAQAKLAPHVLVAATSISQSKFAGYGGR